MIKNKRNLVVSGVLLVATAVSATAYASDLYVGFEGGAQTLNSDMSTYAWTPALGTVGIASSSVSALGGVGDLYIGVASHPIPKMYLALEANITGFSAETDASYHNMNYGDFSAKTEWKYNFGVSIIPGYMLTDKTTLYTRMGVSYGEYTSSESGIVKASYPIENLPGYYGNFVAHDFSYRLGLGVETYFMPKFSARLEYDYWHYNAVTPADYGTNPEVRYTFHPSSSTVMLGVSYHFYQKGGDMVTSQT